MLRSISLPTVVALLCLASACGSDPTGSGNACLDGSSPDLYGEFAATVEGVDGADDVEICGFAPSSDTDGSWTLTLITTFAEHQIHITSEGAGRPGKGTYPIVDHDDEATWGPGKYVVEVIFTGDLLGMAGGYSSPGFTGVSSATGTLTIASSSASRVSGEFEVDVRAIPVGTGPTFGINGTFTSVIQ